MFNNNCGDCDHYDFDTETCLLNDESKATSESCDLFQNEKRDNPNYFS